MCVVRLCLQYQGRGGPLQIGTGGHIRGAVLGGSPLMADISVYARLRGMRPNLRPATYWKLWTSVGGESLLSLLSLLRAPLGKFREGLESAFPEESVHVRRSALSSISRPWRPFADWHGGPY